LGERSELLETHSDVGAEREDRFRDLTDNAPVMIWITDEDNACTYVNKQWVAFTGQSREEAAGSGCLDVVHPDDRSRARDAYVAAAARREDFRVEYRLRRHDGVYRWAIDTGTPQFDGHGTFVGYAGSVVDVSELKYANEAIRTGDKRLRLALAAAQAGIWERDLASNILVWSPETYELFGIEPLDRSPTYEDFRTRVYPEDLPRVDAAVRAALEGTAAEYRAEFRVRHARSGMRWLSAHGRVERAEDGRPLRMSGITLDITDRKQAEASTRDSEERFRQFAENSQDVIWILDAESGQLEYVSPGLERIWGVGCDRLLADRGIWLQMLHPDDRDFAVAWIEQLSPAGQAVVEYRIVRPDGVIRWIRDSAFPIHDENGMLRRIAGIAEDITERRDADQRLRLLAAEVDHRAKNMLSVVQVMLRLTRADSVQEYAAAAQGRIAALARAHTLLSQTRWEGAWLRHLIEEELAPWRRRERGVTVDGPDIALPPRTAQSFAMALHELATNAAKHGALSVGDGRVDLRWTRIADGDLSLRWIESGGPDASLPKRRGLGMTVVERSVRQQLDGNVAFDWRPEGLVCSITVPRAALVRSGSSPPGAGGAAL
jgi:PAS domain S-box-containing protein